jgi:hypothetical protein
VVALARVDLLNVLRERHRLHTHIYVSSPLLVSLLLFPSLLPFPLPKKKKKLTARYSPCIPPVA